MSFSLSRARDRPLPPSGLRSFVAHFSLFHLSLDRASNGIRSMNENSYNEIAPALSLSLCLSPARTSFAHSIYQMGINLQLILQKSGRVVPRVRADFIFSRSLLVSPSLYTLYENNELYHMQWCIIRCEWANSLEPNESEAEDPMHCYVLAAFGPFFQFFSVSFECWMEENGRDPARRGKKLARYKTECILHVIHGDILVKQRNKK